MDTKDAVRLRESIRHLERKLGVLEEHSFSCCGLGSLAQCHALVEIGRAGSMSLIELASMLDLDTSTMSRTVEKLVKGKLVRREADENDRRYVRIYLTGEGNKLYTLVEEEMESYYEKVLKEIPADKQKQVVECLELLCNAISIKDCCSKGMRNKKGQCSHYWR